MSKPNRRRVDVLLVERGLVESRQKAKRAIMAGDVWAGDRPVAKPSEMMPVEAELQLKQPERFVSRGGYKLEHGLVYFGIDVNGAVAIDIGASTGGFTDCLLQRGAKKVYAVDVGKGQLAWKLRHDKRVVVMDGVNARYLKAEDFAEPADIVTIDASFISVTKLLPASVALLKPHGFILALVKPQFEAGRRHVTKGGVVRDESVRQQAVQAVLQFGRMKLGLTVIGTTESPLRGPAGNKEFLVCFQKNAG